MECKAKLVGISNDILTGNINLTFSTGDKSILNNIGGVKDTDLSLKAVKWHEKRSLDSNSYFHVLINKMADSLNISKTRCKNVMIARYGQQDFMPDGTPVVIKTNLQPEVMLEQEFLHCEACRTELQNEKEIIFYKVYRGSHTYNSKEMSILINGVVAEAQELGIDTLSTEEIRKMNERWGTKISTGKETTHE